MMMNTHIILGQNIYNMMNNEGKYLISKNRFIWGNVKPDCASKYKFKKHYYDESIEMILKKIHFLSSLTAYSINKYYGRNKFSEELGVVCHFLCDFFCLPHNQRWEFKQCIKDHVSYENRLGKLAKDYTPKKQDNIPVDNTNLLDVLINYQIKYELEKGFRNDLKYSYLICNSIVSMILHEVIINTDNDRKKAI